MGFAGKIGFFQGAAGFNPREASRRLKSAAPWCFPTKLVFDSEGGVFGGGGGIGAGGELDVAFHDLFDIGDETIYILWQAFGDDFHTPVEQILDVARDRVVLGDLTSCVAESDALDIAVEIGDAADGNRFSFSLDVRHGLLPDTRKLLSLGQAVANLEQAAQFGKVENLTDEGLGVDEAQQGIILAASHVGGDDAAQAG